MGSGEGSRVAIIGDLGGHRSLLVSQLIALGVDVDSWLLPADLTVCQVGDLVHKGPDSAAVVSIVDQIMTKNPGKWVQLLGNHEAQYLAGGPDFWKPRIPEVTAQLVRRWWELGSLTVAAHFSLGSQLGEVDACSGGDLLVTHAGLTAVVWQALGQLPTAAETAAALNRGARDVVWREGGIVTGRVDFRAGPIWALAGHEVYASWFAFGGQQHGRGGPEFAQAHGHTSAYSWQRCAWQIPYDVLAGSTEAKADLRRKVTRVRIGDRTFYGTDAESGAVAESVTMPLVLPLA